jgi:hypothetical protein
MLSIVTVEREQDDLVLCCPTHTLLVLMSVPSTILTDSLLISARRLLRAWALWNRRRDVGIFFIAVCCGGVTAAITIFWNRSLVSTGRPTQPLDEKANDGLKYLPQVVPLPPYTVAPCYRPSPYKYVAAYIIALAVECISLIFMLGRVVWLGSGIKHDVPILKVLGAQ